MSKPVTTEKPVVKYIPLSSYDTIHVGRSAEVMALNHPRLGRQWVSTSTVQSYDLETGTFETLNTVYVLDKEDDEAAIHA